MNRRQWLYMTGLSVAGSGPSVLATGENTPLPVGPFSITLPQLWREGAVIEKVPLKPLYTGEEWQASGKAPETNGTLPPGILKPHYRCRPEHWALRLPATVPDGITVELKEAGGNPEAPQVLIHKASEWAVVLTDGKHQEEKSGELLGRLRQNMDVELTADGKHFTPAFMDGALTFRCLKKRLDFEGGHGVRMLCQWTIEPDLIRKQRLHYLFVGMSDDNSCQIIATFPLNLPGLPEEEDTAAEHLGRSISRYEELVKGYDSYLDDARKWLAAHQGEIVPSLKHLDAAIASLSVKSWS